MGVGDTLSPFVLWEIAWDSDLMIHQCFYDLINHVLDGIPTCSYWVPIKVLFYLFLVDIGSQGNVLILEEKGESGSGNRFVPAWLIRGSRLITHTQKIWCWSFVLGCGAHLVVTSLAMEVQKCEGRSECSNNQGKSDAAAPRRCISNGLDYVLLG